MAKYFSKRQPIWIDLSGTESTEEMLRLLPVQFQKKPVNAAFKKCAGPFVKRLKSSVPSQTGDTKKSIKIKENKRGAGIRVGFFGRDNMFSYFKAYWSNYGTLANRASDHQFVKARRGKYKNRNGGIVAKKFIEKAWDETGKQCSDLFEQEIEKSTNKFFEKYVNK